MGFPWYRILVKGTVQGVGFRPFVYALAQRLNLNGSVKNTTHGVVIEVTGEKTSSFIDSLTRGHPPLARIDSFEVTELQHEAHTQKEGFFIIESEEGKSFTHISPDISICDGCLKELLDPTDRRYLYPFINCTNCGPRFSITEEVPYDRPHTTMAAFTMCEQCNAEYKDPMDRRFHAQPNACPTCGPALEFVLQNGEFTSGVETSPIGSALNVLKRGGILALKGLGGFQLCCDATNEGAVRRLRERKRKSNKPFAAMATAPEIVSRYCELSEEEMHLLQDRRRPIVLLEKKDSCTLPEALAPKNKYLGFMLPYTPLHYLLFIHPSSEFTVLVMTSGNLAEEPIVIDNKEAMQKLSSIADAFLFHNRDIFMRVDDSVVKTTGSGVKGQGARREDRSQKSEERGSTEARKSGRKRESLFSPCLPFSASPCQSLPLTLDPRSLPLSFIRRARGYVPDAIQLQEPGPDVLGCGAEVKNTFTLMTGDAALVSQHIGDMENFETVSFFEEVFENFKQVYHAEPVALACDLHPHYLSTRWAERYAKEKNIPSYGIQHHYAHIASVMAEYGLKEKILGIALDGTGYGTDGNIWGSEFLLCDLNGFTRAAHFNYVPLPGGERAIKECWRTALSALVMSLKNRGEYTSKDLLDHYTDAVGFVGRYGREALENVIKIIGCTQFSPLSSGAGRLFDTVAALTGVCNMNTFEGEAAIALESLVNGETDERYPYTLIPGSTEVIDFSTMVLAIVEEVMQGSLHSTISTKFHNTIVSAVREIALRFRQQYPITKVALSGGVFQNTYILERLCPLLVHDGFAVFTNAKVPCNDACISLGQAYIARERMRKEDPL